MNLYNPIAKFLYLTLDLKFINCSIVEMKNRRPMNRPLDSSTPCREIGGSGSAGRNQSESFDSQLSPVVFSKPNPPAVSSQASERHR